jgi:hypothetical protein
MAYRTVAATKTVHGAAISQVNSAMRNRNGLMVAAPESAAHAMYDDSVNVMPRIVQDLNRDILNV